MVLSGTNTYSGGTTVTGGTLAFLNSWSAPSGNLYVGSELGLFGTVVPGLASSELSGAGGEATSSVPPTTASSEGNSVPEPGTPLIVLAAGGCGLTLRAVRRRGSQLANESRS